MRNLAYEFAAVVSQAIDESVSDEFAVIAAHFFHSSSSFSGQSHRNELNLLARCFAASMPCSVRKNIAESPSIKADG
jgi:hypothetical protein